MKNNKSIFWGLLLVTLGLLWLGRSFGLFHFSWCNVFRLWPLAVIWAGVTLLPIGQLWKNVCNFVILGIAIILLFALPSKSCRHHWHNRWNDKYIIKKERIDKKTIIDEDDEIDMEGKFETDDETITVTVNDGVITINQESEEDGEKKITVKKIKL